MPIEIRELIIKTEISTTGGKNVQATMKPRDLNRLKQQLLEDCRKIIMDGVKRNNYKR